MGHHRWQPEDSESVWELLTLEKWCAASRLQRSWYELDICALNLEWAVDQDLMEVDGRVIKLLDLKSRGVEILAELEKQVFANQGSIVASYTVHMEHVFEWMNASQKQMAWTKNGLLDSRMSESGEDFSSCMEILGNKRKAKESGDCVEGIRRRRKSWWKQKELLHYAEEQENPGRKL
ncbi:hypothetical protein M422DRAFT_254607 [Sphaerobolus stellatus SS14]|uniref:Uncharacterized protein n=1 Tax=Sphaerobolus stellatus (strain SS14) TaxID=990650 RepID=A0A0C9V5L1_SPHS4|nr:hypothetical protein M422DRAFT_254607 [Sphaerobolus stellatus SS14]